MLSSSLISGFRIVEIWHSLDRPIISLVIWALKRRTDPPVVGDDSSQGIVVSIERP